MINQIHTSSINKISNIEQPPIRVGMIGAGYMVKLHSLAMKNLSAFTDDVSHQFKLVQLVDRNRELAENEAKRFGWESSHNDWRTVTRNKNIDLVDIATPNDNHYEMCLDAFANGKNVLCEKPLALNRHQATEMARQAKKSGKVHLVNFTYRAWPAIAQARQLIENGRLGHIRHFEGHFFQDHNNDETIPLHWRFKNEHAGAGALGDIGSHIIDLARFLVGEVESVVALTDQYISKRPLPCDHSKMGEVSVDDLSAALIRFENGASGTIKASWALPGFKNDVYFVVVGEKGSIQFSWERSNELQFFDSSDSPDISGYRTIMLGRAHPGAELFWFPDLGGKLGVGVTGQGMGYNEAFTLSFRNFVQSIRTGTSLSPNFIDGLRCCEIIDAILLSEKEQRWVKVEKAVI